jgi:uncharacterized protein (DUF2267 family)
MCRRRNDFRPGAQDVLLGDVAGGGGGSFSLEAADGVRFTVLSQPLTNEEIPSATAKYVSGKAKVRQVGELAFGKHVQRPQIGDVIGAEAEVSELVEKIVDAAGEEEVAAFRQLADEEAERRCLAHAAGAMGAQHRQFIEIGEQTVPRASADPRIALRRSTAKHKAEDQIMADTPVAALDHTIQQTNIWLKTLAEQLHIEDRHDAYSALRSVLHVLRDRLTPEQAIHLGAQLPVLVRGIYYDGWRIAGKPSDERQPAEFATLVAADLPPSLARDALRVTRAVFGLLEKELDRGDGQGHRDAAASLAGLVARAQIPRTAAALTESWRRQCGSTQRNSARSRSTQRPTNMM